MGRVAGWAADVQISECEKERLIGIQLLTNLFKFTVRQDSKASTYNLVCNVPHFQCQFAIAIVRHE